MTAVRPIKVLLFVVGKSPSDVGNDGRSHPPIAADNAQLLSRREGRYKGQPPDRGRIDAMFKQLARITGRYTAFRDAADRCHSETIQTERAGSSTNPYRNPGRIELARKQAQEHRVGVNKKNTAAPLMPFS